MKKRLLPVALCLFFFVVAYLILCFMIPGMRIKLDAEPMEYFVKSILHMVPFKAVISAAVALAAGIFSWVIVKKQNK